MFLLIPEVSASRRISYRNTFSSPVLLPKSASFVLTIDTYLDIVVKEKTAGELACFRCNWIHSLSLLLLFATGQSRASGTWKNAVVLKQRKGYTVLGGEKKKY